MARKDDRLIDANSVAAINENFVRALTLVDVDAGDIEALYALAKCSVTFDSDGGSDVPSQLVSYNAKATEPTAPEKEGYTFGGWFIGEDEYDFDDAVTADITLTAAWEAE